MIIDNQIQRAWTKENEAEVVVITNHLAGHTTNGWWAFLLLDWQVDGPLMDAPEFAGPFVTYEDACLLMGVLPDTFDKPCTNS